jgi:hypothetical protein
LSFSYWIDNLGFITEGKTCCYIHHTILLVFPNWPIINFITTAPSGTPAACSLVDQELFAVATRVTIGDGKIASFW